MWLVGAADWQDVMVAAITLAGVIVNGFVTVYIATRIRTPSGDSIGRVAERTHDLASVTVAAVTGLDARRGKADGDSEREAE